MKIQAENLEKVFNLPPSSQIIEGEYTTESTDVSVIENKPLVVVAPVSTKLEDSDYIRTSLKELASSTKDALELALQIQAEEPGNFKNTEAVAKMADAVTKVLGNLIHLNKVEKDEEFRAKPQEEQQGPKVVNNTLIMTTEALIDKIIKQTKQLKEK